MGDERVTSTEDALLDELKALRRGAGVRAGDLALRLGPTLRTELASTTFDGVSLLKQLTTFLQLYLATMPRDLAVAVQAGLAMGHYDSPLLQDRIEQLSREMKRDVRTVRRRVDSGLHYLATAIIESSARKSRQASSNPDWRWHIKENHALLRLDRDQAESLERRTIVAHEDGLDHFDLAFSLPRESRSDRHDLYIDVLYGGRLTRVERESDTRFGFRLDLPTVLERGDTHEYSVLYRVPAGQPMRPHYVFVPMHPCGLFDLRIKFDIDRLPAKVWRLTAAFHRDIDELGPDESTLLTLDKYGEVQSQFHDLKPGYGYGVAWSHMPDDRYSVESSTNLATSPPSG